MAITRPSDVVAQLKYLYIYICMYEKQRRMEVTIYACLSKKSVGENRLIVIMCINLGHSTSSIMMNRNVNMSYDGQDHEKVFI